MVNLHLRWALAQQLFRQTINFLVYLGAARFIAPDNFGALSIAMVWIAAGSVLLDFGFAPALVQRLKIGHEQLEGVFCLNVLTGVLLVGLFICIAPFIALVYKDPLLEHLLIALSILLPVNALSIIPSVFISREMKFKAAALRDLAASAISSIIFYLSYLAELGIWSLVIQIISTSLLSLILSWRLIIWRPAFDFKKISSVMDLLQFSSNMFAFSIFKFIAQNIDLALIGYFLGPASAGLYGMSLKLVSGPFTSLRAAVGSYLFPKFSSMQNRPGKILDLFISGNRRLSVTLGFLVVFIYLATPLVIPVLFKGDWRDLSSLIVNLSIIGYLQSIMAPTGELMKSIGKPQWLLRWGIFFSALLAFCIVIGVNWGISGVLQGIIIAHLIGILVSAYSVRKYLGISIKLKYRYYIFPVLFLIFTIYFMWFLDKLIDIDFPEKTLISLSIYLILNIFYSKINRISLF